MNWALSASGDRDISTVYDIESYGFMPHISTIRSCHHRIHSAKVLGDFNIKLLLQEQNSLVAGRSFLSTDLIHKRKTDPEYVSDFLLGKGPRHLDPVERVFKEQSSFFF